MVQEDLPSISETAAELALEASCGIGTADPFLEEANRLCPS